MTPQTEAKPNQKAASDAIEHHVIKVLILDRACRFNNSDSIATDKGISILPAIWRGFDWRQAKDDERPDGFGLAQRVVDHQRGQTFIKRGFMPLSAVREVVFG